MAGTRPIPVPDAVTRPFWEALRQGELRLPLCPSCRIVLYPPPPACPKCLGAELEWRALSGRGRLTSWTDISLDVLPGVTPPFTIAAVELLEPGRPEIVALIRTGRNACAIDAAVTVGFSDPEPESGTVYPEFNLDSEEDAV
jgi:hypothetical protein